MPPCESLDVGTNAYYNVSANHTGGIATYACNIGYNPIVDLDLFVKTCQDDGKWTPAGQTACSIVKCGEPPMEENSFLTGTKTTGYVYNDKVTAKCSKGAFSLYMEPGTESTPLESLDKTCTEFGTWSTNLISCLCKFNFHH